MQKIKQISLIISVLALIFIVFALVKKNLDREHLQNPEIVQIGSENFSLVNQDGKRVTEKDLLGHYTIVLFGFSRCPHVCPAQLSLLGKSLDEVPNLQAFFISVDPENDTVERLKDFHSRFHPKIQMLVGDSAMTEKLINDYKIYVRSDNDPEKFNHSTIIYLIGKDGKYLAHFVPTDEDELADEIKKNI